MALMLKLVILSGWLGIIALFQIPVPGTAPPAAPAVPKAAAPVPAAKAKTPPTDAERITATRESVERTRATLEKLEKQLDDPTAEYRQAETEFAELDKSLKGLQQRIEQHAKDGPGGMAAESQKELTRLTEERELARERFDIAIRKQKATREAIVNLKERLKADEETLNKLEGKGPPASPPEQPVTELTPAPKATPPPAAPAAPVTTTPKPATTASPPPSLPASAVPGPLARPEASTAVTNSTPSSTTDSAPPAPAEDDPLVRQATEGVDAARARLREAEALARLAEERVRTMERSVQSVSEMARIEKDAAAQAEKTDARLAEQLRQNPAMGPIERRVMADRQADAERRAWEARERAQRLEERAENLNETLHQLRQDLTLAQQEVQSRQKDVENAETAVKELKSPLATRNLFRWAREHGPALVAIVVGTILVHLFLRMFSRHIVRFVARNSRRGSPEDRENRASTLVGVFRYAGGLVVLGGGLVMLLDEVGVPVVPLMGGAAVLGLAVAFGAQNLIRDYFCGFMMLLEDQYSVNDVVRIGNIAGLVEQITLRVTVLRDLEGVRHFVPHGTITSVSNLTHGWSRAMFDIPVAYKEDVDRVMAVLQGLGKELRSHPDLGRYILEDPEMLGVDSLADSGVVIKFLVKTRPLQQWPVKRELLRRIKNRFDELGIEIPFPHRTVYHRGLNEAGAANLSIHLPEPHRRAG